VSCRGVTNLGSPADLETLAALHPNLIVTQSTTPPALIAERQAIAPVAQLNPGATPGAAQLQFYNAMLPLAPIFCAQQRASQIIARFNIRATALAGFVHGRPVAIMGALSTAQNFALNTTNQSMAGIFQLARVSVEGPLANGTPPQPSGNQINSTEPLPEVAAPTALVTETFPYDDALFKSLPLYPQLLAVKNGQIYFTKWRTRGPIGFADALGQFQKGMFGVTGLEATRRRRQRPAPLEPVGRRRRRRRPDPGARLLGHRHQRQRWAPKDRGDRGQARHPAPSAGASPRPAARASRVARPGGSCATQVATASRSTRRALWESCLAPSGRNRRRSSAMARIARSSSRSRVFQCLRTTQVIRTS
jgi:hypothetical protein